MKMLFFFDQLFWSLKVAEHSIFRDFEQTDQFADIIDGLLGEISVMTLDELAALRASGKYTEAWFLKTKIMEKIEQFSWNWGVETLGTFILFSICLSWVWKIWPS